MHKTLVLDRYTNKYLTINQVPDEIYTKLSIWDKIVYEQPDSKTGNMKASIWTIITEWVQSQVVTKEKPFYSANFIRVLEWTENDEFNTQQDIALKIFPTFKREFQAEFPNSVPITARFHIFADQLYFFFYSEERYVFTEFVKKFREKLGKNMFLFQVWARDMMRMSPWADCMMCSSGQTLCCKKCTMLPNIEIESVVMQNLEWRDIERLKWKCSKLKCCLLYELDLYISESKKFPHKWAKVDITGLHERKFDENDDSTWIVTSFNILTQEVNIKTKDWIIRIPVDKLKWKVRSDQVDSNNKESENDSIQNANINDTEHGHTDNS